jgi:hypothetical protein
MICGYTNCIFDIYRKIHQHREMNNVTNIVTDEGMTNGLPIFVYLVFGPERVSFERLSRPVKATV